MTDDVCSIDIPADVVDRIEARLQGTEWESPSEYITYVLQEVLYRIEEETDGTYEESIDEDEVKDRLRSLGYLNK